MRLRELTEGVGRIVKGVNTTPDVGPDEIKKQAAKFGNTVDRDGRPPTLGKSVKGKSTNVLYNLGLAENVDHRVDELNIPRKEMPQVSERDLEGEYDLKKGTISIDLVKTSQQERVPGLVRKTVKNIKSGKYKKPLLIDKDNQIINGHHRYDAHLALGDERIPVVKVMDATVLELKDKFSHTTSDVFAEDEDNDITGLKDITARTEVYVDMDGVLADFFGEWAKLAGVKSFRDIQDPESSLDLVRNTDEFWLKLPKTDNADALLDLILSVWGSYKILSTPLAGDPNSEPHKIKWIKQNLKGRMPEDIILSHDKAKHATQPDGTPNILIDDYGVNIRKWEAAGGIGFKHKDHKFERTAKNIKKHLQSNRLQENISLANTKCPRTKAEKCQCENVLKVAESQQVLTAVCRLEQSDTVKGTILLKQNPGQATLIVGKITGLEPGKHGFHIHEFGDLSQGCESAGAHYNPDNVDHGDLDEGHVGDLGNVTANSDGVADIEIVAERVDLGGERSVVGRSIVVHSNEDDLGKGGDAESLKTGNAGDRLACGVITLREPIQEKWSKKYKKSIDCSNPKGFSQKAHCQGKNKKTTKEQKEIAIHRSSERFNDIDLSKSADGTFWLSSPDSDWDNIVTTGKGVDHAYEISPKANLATWDDVDKYSIDELEQMGYDGVRMADGNDISYQIWNTDILSRIELDEVIDVDVDAIHSESLKKHLLSKPSLYEDRDDFKSLMKFLNVHKTDKPQVGNSYVYASVQAVPMAKFVSIGYFDKAYELVRLEDNYAYFQVDNKIKRFPETGTLSGDALTEIYFFESPAKLNKFVMLFDLAFSDYKKSSKLLDENFADGKKKGKSRPGRFKRAGVSCKGSVTSLRKKAKNSSGEKQKGYHWCANMKSGKR